MKTLSRRDLLKTSLLAPAAVAAQGMGPMGAAIEAISQETRPQPVNSVPNPSASGTYRERLQLDFGWRFHLGDDPAARRPDFDDTSWRTLDVPHDWSIEGPVNPPPEGEGNGGYF